MENTEKLQKKLKSIRRGAYWFGAIGKISMISGAVAVFAAVFLNLAIYYNWPSISALPWISSLAVGIPYFIYGYLFLLGRDAFEAIEELIREVGEIV